MRYYGFILPSLHADSVHSSIVLLTRELHGQLYLGDPDRCWHLGTHKNHRLDDSVWRLLHHLLFGNGDIDCNWLYFVYSWCILGANNLP
jgi:hypothetical protein